MRARVRRARQRLAHAVGEQLQQVRRRRARIPRRQTIENAAHDDADHRHPQVERVVGYCNRLIDRSIDQAD